MLRNYLKTAWNVLQRRRFFTAVSLFGIALTLAVLTLVAALFDHTFAASPPETQMDRTLGIYFAEMSGEHMSRNGFAGYGLLDKYARDLPGVERMAVASDCRPSVTSFVNGAKVQLVPQAHRRRVLAGAGVPASSRAGPTPRTTWRAATGSP